MADGYAIVNAVTREWDTMTKISLIAAAASALALTTFGASAATINLAGMTTSGNATMVGSELQLTAASGSQGGSAFTDLYSFGAGASFSASFEFSISGNGSGADGLAFVMQNEAPNAIGSFGGGLGYETISPSIAVEFDTYSNGSAIDNSSANHVGINVNGNITSVALADPGFTLENSNETHFAWVNFSSGLLEVFVSEDSTQPGSSLLSYSFSDLSSDLGGEAYFGFTAATGGLVSDHRIQNFELTVTEPAPVPLPAGLPLALLGLGALVGLKRRKT